VLDILAIEPDSIAVELGLCAGDRLLALNGEPVRDLLDYQRLVQAEELLVEVERADGELWEIEVAKDADEPLGLRLPHPEPEQCGNNCIFCFVHQLPPGMRRSLYVKDEDYRFSYLYGAYVTLTNLDQPSLQRILTQRLSPLYVSVHATEAQLRERLLGRQGPPLLDQLQQLVAGGITVHAQVVICPGINDGSELERTFRDLVALAGRRPNCRCNRRGWPPWPLSRSGSPATAGACRSCARLRQQRHAPWWRGYRPGRPSA